MLYNVRDFGAVGNGVALDTEAIQKAVDACFENGGGRVLVPAGDYLVGKIVLKDHVTFEIGAGATLIASSNIEDYPTSVGFAGSIFNRGVANDSRSERRAILYACEAKNIAIIGRGTIDGRHPEFLVGRKDSDQAKRFQYDMHNVEERFYAHGPEFIWRPILLFIEACEDVLVDGINFKNAPCYTLQFRSSRNINITNINIRNYIGADNADGIHFSSCCDVRISNCDLECGDDCIAIDSNDGTPSERYAVQNCLFVSRNNCFRIFTCLGQDEAKRNLLSWGRVSDIAISNCVVKEASSFIYVNVDQGIVERVSATNASGKIRRLGTTFLITTHNAKANQITFSNWNFTSRGVGYIYSDRPDSITNVKLEQLDIEVCPQTQLYGNGLHMPVYPNGLPLYWLSHYVPYFLQIVCAEDVSIRSLSVHWGETDLGDIHEIGEVKELIPYWPKPTSWEPHWPVIKAEKVKNLEIDGFKGEPFGGHSYTIELESVEETKLFRHRLTEADILADENCKTVLL